MSKHAHRNCSRLDLVPPRRIGSVQPVHSVGRPLKIEHKKGRLAGGHVLGDP